MPPPDWWPMPWFGMMFGPLMMIVFLVVVLLIVIPLLRGIGVLPHGQQASTPAAKMARDFLDERFARGEIDKVEYEEKRRLLAQK